MAVDPARGEIARYLDLAERKIEAARDRLRQLRDEIRVAQVEQDILANLTAAEQAAVQSSGLLRGYDIPARRDEIDSLQALIAALQKVRDYLRTRL